MRNELMISVRTGFLIISFATNTVRLKFLNYSFSQYSQETG
jgi:hypothetical protein